jgi:hypothetical protein
MVVAQEAALVGFVVVGRDYNYHPAIPPGWAGIPVELAPVPDIVEAPLTVAAVVPVVAWVYGFA